MWPELDIFAIFLLLAAETPQQVDNFLEPWLIANKHEYPKQVHEWKRHKNPKKKTKKKEVHETDIINMYTTSQLCFEF